MKNVNKLAQLASMVYMASLIREVSQGNIKEEYIYYYPEGSEKKIIVTADRVKYSDQHWSISFSNRNRGITIVGSCLADFKDLKKVLTYILDRLLQDSSKHLLKEKNV